MQLQPSLQTIQNFAASLTLREEGFSSYHDRRISPAATFEAIQPFFRELGITRVGFLTGLDTVGIPVAFATRPNSYTLSVFQGKGVDPDAARASAAMEALETSIAEIAPPVMTSATVAEIASSGTPMIDLHSTARCVPAEIGSGSIPWVGGLDVLSGQQVMVPWWLAGMDHRGERPAGFEQSSDGLASGNTQSEALLHGLCELIERDAWTIAQLKSERELADCLVDPSTVEDAVLDIMLGRIREAGLQLVLLDMTTDLQVPAFLAVLIPDSTSKRADARWSQICGGCGCHPDPVRAMLRAITEAAQSRLTAIAGSRDDFSPRIYQHMRADNGLGKLLALSSERVRPYRDLDIGASRHASIDGTIRHLLGRLKLAGIRQVIAVPMQDAGLPVSVVRVIVPGLEVELFGQYMQLGIRAANTIRRSQH
ncbi:YcaO-like family protein [Rhizobium sp. XQZ8]|uniref:YcaO-like family protein n=1 Tax=Rhizobium populisoli TaxID=2859785 RepID=UPI001C680CEE|nr:YcaO-like family protein [Rhizobium populisoli]MBW6422100.1 YcaO-like family protein [Rhizobium populisoli]